MRKRQNRVWATTQNRKETKQSRRKEGNRKEREMSGAGCEEGEREPGRGHQRTSELNEDISCEQRIRSLQTGPQSLQRPGGPSTPAQPHKSAS